MWQPSEKMARWKTLAQKWSRQTKCPAALILAVIQQESGGQPGVSKYEPGYEQDHLARCKEISMATGLSTDKIATSYGLMQLMVPTAWGYLSAVDKGSGAITALLDPNKNIRYGAAHLATKICNRDITPAVIRDAAGRYNGGGSDSAYARNVFALWQRYDKWLRGVE